MSEERGTGPEQWEWVSRSTDWVPRSGGCDPRSGERVPRRTADQADPEAWTRCDGPTVEAGLLAEHIEAHLQQ